MRGTTLLLVGALLTASATTGRASEEAVFGYEGLESVASGATMTSDVGPGPFAGDCVGVLVPHLIKDVGRRVGANPFAKERLVLVEKRAEARFLAAAVQLAFTTCKDASAAIVKQAPNQFQVYTLSADLTREFAPLTHPVGQAIVNATSPDTLLGTIVRRDVRHDPVYRTTPVNVEARALELVGVVASNAPDADPAQPLRHLTVWAEKHPDEDCENPVTALDFVGDQDVVASDSDCSHRPMGALWFASQGAYSKFEESLYHTIWKQMCRNDVDTALTLVAAGLEAELPVAPVDRQKLFLAAVCGAGQARNPLAIERVLDEAIARSEMTDDLAAYAVEYLVEFGALTAAGGRFAALGLADLPDDFIARHGHRTMGELRARLQEEGTAVEQG